MCWMWSRCWLASLRSVSIEHGLQLFLFTMEADAVYEEILVKQREGVVWTKVGGALVFGWANLEALTQVRVSYVQFYLLVEALKIHLSQFGQVVRASRGRCRRTLPNSADGLVHLTMQLENLNWLPGYIQLIDYKGVPSVLSLNPCGNAQLLASSQPTVRSLGQLSSASSIIPHGNAQLPASI